MQTLWQDLRYGFRMLSKSPGFTRQRTQEIGVRMALGARTRDILKMILGEGILLSLLGVGIGLAGAFVLTRFLKSLLFGITPTDPITFAAISLLLIVIALITPQFKSDLV